MLVLSSCGGSSVEVPEIPFEDQNISISEKIKLALDDEYLASMHLTDEQRSYVQEFYQNNGYKSLWSNDSTMTEEGQRMANVLARSEQLGLPAGRNNKGNGTNFVQNEILTTASIAGVLHDLKYGIIDFKEKKRRPVGAIPVNELEAMIEFDESEDLRKQFLKFGPQDTSYQVLGTGLIKMIDTYPMDTNTFECHTIKKDTVEAIKRATEALVSKGYLSEGADTTAMQTALKLFQEHNGLKPDGVIGKYTSKALNESMAHKRDRIILAMDKIRSQDAYLRTRLEKPNES